MTNEAKRYKSLHELSATQAIAIEIIDGGGTHLEASEAAGVDRTTVSRWVVKHPAFVAEINRRRRDRAIESGIRIASITATSLRLVEEAITAGDLAIATRWLMRFGPSLLGSGEHAPLSADEVIEERRRALPAGGELFEMLDSMDGRSTDDASSLIEQELKDSG